MLRRFLAHNPLPLRLLLSIITLPSLLCLVYVLILPTTAERRLLVITVILLGLFTLFLSSSSPIRYWKGWQWVLFFLSLLVGLGCSILFIESQSGAGDYIWTIYHGFPIEWLRQWIGFDSYRPDAFVHQVMALHPEWLSTDIYWNHFILVLIFYTHLAIIITTFCGRAIRGLFTQPELSKDPEIPDSQAHDDFLISVALCCKAIREFETPVIEAQVIKPPRLYNDRKKTIPIMISSQHVTTVFHKSLIDRYA